MIDVEIFKKECLKFIEEVQATKQSVIITKHNKPIAKLIPIKDDNNDPLFGKMKGTGRIIGDIINLNN